MRVRRSFVVALLSRSDSSARRSFTGTCTRAGDTTSTAVYRDTGVPEQNLAPFSVVRD